MRPRAVTNISSCQVYVISRRGIVQLGSSFGSIFLLFPLKKPGLILIVAGENPRPLALGDSPVRPHERSIVLNDGMEKNSGVTEINEILMRTNYYTCQIKCHACGSKTSISRLLTPVFQFVMPGRKVCAITFTDTFWKMY